ncbi:head-tail adaptor protein [Jannaschia sp. W003]|uniref:head-tail adaptor protein n=1 Tax=Jannaschia sp. W003 TaxID=2867012 RepID=UPI0021A446F2|nr:head-tail adaptor protein [Jannaschia sp. W003]UWQ21006.1 head-tail adaptor protein [Jannaschia sp. W003]
MSGPRLTRRLDRLVPVRTGDGAGGYAEGWESRGTLWAEVDARSGGVRVTETGAVPRLRVRITCHALPQGHPGRPAPGDRLRDGARLFAVEAVHEDDPSGRFLVCFAREWIEGDGA